MTGKKIEASSCAGSLETSVQDFPFGAGRIRLLFCPSCRNIGHPDPPTNIAYLSSLSVGRVSTLGNSAIAPELVSNY